MMIDETEKISYCATCMPAAFFTPVEGPVKISCTDDKGRNRDIWIRVKFTGQ